MPTLRDLRPGTALGSLFLAKLKFGSAKWLSEEEINDDRRLADLLSADLKVSTNVDVGFITDTLLVQLRAEVLGQPLADVTIRYPRDWWEAVKARFAPAWVLRRWPVIETVETFQAFALAKGIRIPPDHRAGTWMHYARTEVTRDPR